VAHVDPSTGNLLLDALLRESPALRGLGERVSLPMGAVLGRAGEDMRHVYFPITAVVSVLVGTSSGELADALTVGNEGMVSLAVWLDVRRGLETLVQQSGGELVRIESRRFCRALEANRSVRRLLHHFTAYSLRFSYQNAVCNAHHSVEQRTCRWLLNTADRAGTSQLALSHALLAQMLGVRRQSVSEVTTRLKQEGVIEQRRAQIEIRRRRDLERRACECYQALWDVYAQVVRPWL
jgi:CRP-like cAMP-binding protein